MIFRCKSCGANTVWNPEKNQMCCPHCESLDSEEEVRGETGLQCANCGAPMEPKEYNSATKCEHCGAYTVFEEKVSGEYQPHLILPFRISKAKAKETIKEEFKKKIFSPSTFLKEAMLDQIEGDYIPFFLFDFKCRYQYQGTGKKVRVWRSGNTEYTETSIYNIHRDMKVDFQRMPVDASVSMPDGEMDLLEPFKYDELTTFEPKYMSGFYGEYFSENAATLEPRAEAKAKSDADSLIKESIHGYNSVVPTIQNFNCNKVEENYTLLPVWNYVYQYHGKKYFFRLNGQTGKLVGKAPISVGKVFGYGATMFASLSLILVLINGILGVL